MNTQNLDMASVKNAGTNETPNVLQTLLRFVTYLHVLQGLHLRCGWFPPAIPNVKS